ncbi:MAG: YkvA family protein [Nocardioidaceae bacterium]
MTLSTWWQIALSVAGGLVLVWLVLVGYLFAHSPHGQDQARMRDSLRLVPDVARLLRRLAADPTLPRGVRIRLALLLAYLVSPLDIIPDFIPVIGYLDDVIIVVLALRSVARRAGPDALDRHWPGTPDGLRALKRLARLDPSAGSAA